MMTVTAQNATVDLDKVREATNPGAIPFPYQPVEATVGFATPTRRLTDEEKAQLLKTLRARRELKDRD